MNHVRICSALPFLALVVLTSCAEDARTARQEAPIPTSPALPEDKPIGSPPAPPGQGPSDPDAPTEFTTTESGLRYRILRKSGGATPKTTDTVTVNYRGWLDNGKEFDSSYKRNSPTSFPLNGVIKGWTEGLQLVNEGGMIELEIPAKLGYGIDGSPPTIPPGATLHFIVELLKIK